MPDARGLGGWVKKVTGLSSTNWQFQDGTGNAVRDPATTVRRQVAAGPSGDHTADGTNVPPPCGTRAAAERETPTGIGKT